MSAAPGAPAGHAPSPVPPSGAAGGSPARPRRSLVRRLVVAPLVAVIRLYQNIVSPMRPATCRYYPSCSAYAVTALERFGLVKGTWLAARRLIRCHPWSPGGVDHVPPAPPS